VGRAVERGRLIGEARRTIERTFQTNDLLDPVQTAEGRAQLSNGIERTEATRLVSLLDRQVCSDFSLKFEVARDPRQLTGGHQKVADNSGGCVIADRGRRRRQNYAEGMQAFVGR